MNKAVIWHWRLCVGAVVLILLATSAIAENPDTSNQVAENQQASSLTLATDAEKIGYSYGQMFGRRLAGTMTGIDIDAFIAGIKDAYSGQASKMTEQQINESLQAYQSQLQEQQQQQQQEIGSRNLALGKTFMAENAGKEGVQTTDSGLQYKIISEGQGDSPKLTDTVEVHYTGSLIGGEVFDSSVERGTSVSFPVKGVIPGWTEALQLMKPGGKWQLFIPPELAYGPAGSGRIGPNETLLFEVELIAIK